MTEVIITKATIKDVPQLSELSASTFYDTYAIYNTEENLRLYMEHFRPEQLEKEIRTNDIVFFIAWLEEQMVGYAKVTSNNHPAELAGYSPIEIERIYVLPNFKGKKIGSKLIHHCIEYGRQQEKDVLWLGVWEHNPKAIAFYTSLGFEKFGEHDFVFGEDIQNDWMMKLDL